MSNFNNTILTDRGKTLLSQAIAEKKTITFTKMKTSSRDYNSISNLNQLSELEEVKQTVDISDVSKQGNDKILIQATIDNSNLTTGYDVKTLGIYAKDNLNNEVLFSVSTTTKSDYLPQNNGINLSTIDVNITYVLSDNANVSITVQPNAYATVDSINKVNDKIDNIKINDASEKEKGIAKIYTTSEVETVGDSAKSSIFETTGTRWNSLVATLDNTKILTIKGVANLLRKLIRPATATTYGVISENRVKEIAPTPPRATATTYGTISENRVKELVPTSHLAEKTEVSQNALPVGAIVSFVNGAKNIPTGFLQCNGTAYNKATYPDLFNVLGVEKLPDLNKDIGQVVAFATDNLPDGWLWYDEIDKKVNRTDYPDLYNYLVKQYGSITNVPKISDRFIRGIGEELALGQLQGDAIRDIIGTFHMRPNGITNIDGAFTNGAGNKGNTDGIRTINNASKHGVRFKASEVVPTAEENRPKAIALKYGIKAKTSYLHYIKAFGNTENLGSINLATLTREIQNKTNISDLAEIDNKINNLVTVRTLDDWIIYKYSNGTMLQTGKTILKMSGRVNANYKINFPESFKEKPFVLMQNNVPEGINTNIDNKEIALGDWDPLNLIYTVDYIRTTGSTLTVTVTDTDTWHNIDWQVGIFALGRWK